MIFSILAVLPVLSLAMDQPLPHAQERIRQGVLVPEGAVCFGSSLPAFFRVPHHGLYTANNLKYTELTKAECREMCSENVDKDGRRILCSSFSYDQWTSVCFIHRTKTSPGGIMPLEEGEGITYTEKFCLPRDAPLSCAEASFYREQQKILVGHAFNVTVQATLEGCVASCVGKGRACRSAMYFYEAGECILNRKDKDQDANVYITEHSDKVVYFENGCLSSKRPSKRRRALPDTSESNDDASGLEAASAIDEALEYAQPKSKKEALVAKLREILLEREATTDDWELSPWSKWSLCDSPNGRRKRTRVCRNKARACDPAKRTIDIQWCDRLPQAERAFKPLPRLNLKRAAVRREQVERPAVQPAVRFPANFPLTSDPALDAAWAPWTPKHFLKQDAACTSFAQPQPCSAGQRLGFQTRACSSGRCSGPSFRYCFLKC